MGNLVEDIIAEKQQKISKGMNDVYYKKDLSAGVLLIMRLIGVIGLIASLGAVAFGAISSLVSAAAGNPKLALQVWQVISKNSQSILNAVQAGGKSLDRKYQELSPRDKKYVQTVVLLVSGNLDWDDLN